MLLSIVAPMMPSAAASYSDQAMTINVIGSHAAKVALLNGQRFIFSHDGWGSTKDYIDVYNATSDWEKDTLLASSPYTTADIWAQTFPSVWSDLVILYGAQDNSARAFFGYYNITSKTFSLQNNTNAYYFSQLYYIEELGLFYINPLNGAWKDQMLFSTPANLFNMSAWSNYSMGAYYHTDAEHMFTYNPDDNLGYLLQWHVGYSDFYRVNMTTHTLTQIYNHTGSPTGRPRGYISANDTMVFFSMHDTSIVHYYYYSAGTGMVNFYNGSDPGSSSEEWHGHIFPFNNVILIGNVRDGDTDSYYSLLLSNGTVLDNFTGVRGHFSDNRPVLDNGKIVIGGEGGDAGGYADVQYIQTYASVTAHPLVTYTSSNTSVLKITPTATVTDYVVRITVVNDTGTSANNTLYAPTVLHSNFSDLRFTNANTSAVLDAYNDTYAFYDGANATFYVRVPSMTSGVPYYINVTWNNATQFITSSISAVYPNGYDDFEGTLSAKWKVTDTVANITDGVLTMSDGSGGEFGVYWNGTSVNATQVYEFWFRETLENINSHQFYTYFRGDLPGGAGAHRHRLMFIPETATDTINGSEDLVLSSVHYDFVETVWIKVRVYRNLHR